MPRHDELIPYSRSFGYWLKRYREEVLNVGQKTLAHNAALSPGTIGAYERNERKPSMFTREELANVLGLDMYDSNADFTAFALGRLRIAVSEFEPKKGTLPPLEPVGKETDSPPVSVDVVFDFPQEIKIPCEQYLLYFAEFLRDVGVEATIELQEEVNGVLFSVTPKDRGEALETIRKALEIYLRLPTSHGATAIVPMDASIAVQRLAANVQHLQGQLMLANATLQQKEITIQDQRRFIDQQHLTAQVLVQSLQKELEDDTTSEPLVGDIVRVKKWDWEFLEVDFATLLKRLKDMFGNK